MIDLTLTLGVLFLAIGCANTPPRATVDLFMPKGPGTVFGSVHEAVMDAVVWSHAEAQRAPKPERRCHAGTITAVAGGFSYAPPVVASDRRPFRTEIRLTANAVARYRMVPSMGLSDPQRARLLEQLTADDRAVVDRHDPHHRPTYLLTPRLKLLRYAGSEQGVETLARIRVDRSRGEQTYERVLLAGMLERDSQIASGASSHGWIPSDDSRAASE